MMKLKVGGLSYDVIRAEQTYHRNEITTVSDEYETVTLYLITEQSPIKELMDEILESFNGDFSVELGTDTEEMFSGYKLSVGRRQLITNVSAVEFVKGVFEVDKEEYKNE